MDELGLRRATVRTYDDEPSVHREEGHLRTQELHGLGCVFDHVDAIHQLEAAHEFLVGKSVTDASAYNLQPFRASALHGRERGLDAHDLRTRKVPAQLKEGAAVPAADLENPSRLNLCHGPGDERHHI